MLKDVTLVEPLAGFQLRLRFEDGAEGTVDVSTLVRFEGVFAPLLEPEYFRQVRVDPALGTIVWPNGADLDPDVLYSKVTGSVIQLESVRD